MLVDANAGCEDGVGAISAEWMEGTTVETVVPIRTLVEVGEKSRSKAMERLAQAMAELADKELIARMGAEAKRNSGLYDWGHKGEMIWEELIALA